VLILTSSIKEQKLKKISKPEVNVVFVNLDVPRSEVGRIDKPAVAGNIQMVVSVLVAYSPIVTKGIEWVVQVITNFNF
jgi:hypothetical protein